MKEAFGFIETVGKIAAIEAMDTAVKAADVTLAGLENSRGSGRMTVKVTGEISAVKAAVEAAIASVQGIGGAVYAHKVIASPSEELEKMLADTMGKRDETSWYAGDRTGTKDAEEAETVLEKSVQSEPAALEPQSTEEVAAEKKPTCNLCLDPQCPRVRGEARVKCIHYSELVKK